MWKFGKKEDRKLMAVADGKLMKLCEVHDEAFASLSMGDGYAIAYDGEMVYAPVSGEVVACFPGGHAIGIQANFAEVMVHIGIDTVQLQGEGFNLLVKQGDTIKQGQPIVNVSSSFLKEKGYDPTIMVIVTSGEDVHLDKENVIVKAKEVIASC